MKRILVIGSTNIDYVIQVEQMAIAGETIIGSGLARNFGGKGANQAYACGKLGGAVTFVSAIGNDEMGMRSIDNLRTAGVQVQHVRICKEALTGMALICVNSHGDNCIVLASGANEACDEDWIVDCNDAFMNTDIVMVQLETPHKAVWSAIRNAYQLGKIIILDPAPAPIEGIPEDIYSCLTYLTPNLTELQRLTGMPVSCDSDVYAAATELVHRGAKNVIVTMGDKGVLLANTEDIKTFPAWHVEPLDTTAAGDTFNAALAVKLSEEEVDIDAVINYANAAAAISTTRAGAQPSIPSKWEVQEFIDNNQRG